MNDAEKSSYLYSIEYLFGRYLMSKDIKSNDKYIVWDSRLVARPKDNPSSRWVYNSAIFPTNICNAMTVAAIFDYWLNYEPGGKRFRARSKDVESLNLIYDIITKTFDVDMLVGEGYIILHKTQVEVILYNISENKSINFLNYVSDKTRESLMLCTDNKMYDTILGKVRELPVYIPRVMKGDKKKSCRKEFMEAPIIEKVYKLTPKQIEAINQLNIYYGNKYVADGCVVNGVVIDEEKYKVLREEYVSKKRLIEQNIYEEQIKMKIGKDGFAEVE